MDINPAFLSSHKLLVSIKGYYYEEYAKIHRKDFFFGFQYDFIDGLEGNSINIEPPGCPF